jgi:hypothetical protein
VLFPGGAPTLSAAANAVDLFQYWAIGGDVYIVPHLNFS